MHSQKTTLERSLNTQEYDVMITRSITDIHTERYVHCHVSLKCEYNRLYTCIYLLSLHLSKVYNICQK